MIGLQNGYYDSDDGPKKRLVLSSFTNAVAFYICIKSHSKFKEIETVFWGD